MEASFKAQTLRRSSDPYLVGIRENESEQQGDEALPLIHAAAPAEEPTSCTEDVVPGHES